MIKTENQSVAVRGSRDSNDLIPLHEPFDIARRGFDRRQVLDHLETLDARSALNAADRDAALAQVAELSRVLDHLRRKADEATAQVQRLLQEPMAQAGARIQRILQLVVEEAAEVKAHTEAEIVELKARADDQLTALRTQASREAKSLLDQTRRQCDQLESESAARQKAAEQAIAQREAKTNERIRNSELRSLAGLHLLLRVMDENLTDRVAAVQRDESALRELRAQMTREATALQSLRAEVTAAVTAAHGLSTEALEQVRKIPAEPAVDETDDPTEQPDIPIQRDGEEATNTTVAYKHRRLPGNDVVHDGIGPCSPSAHDGSPRRRRHGDVITAVVKLLHHPRPRRRADQGLWMRTKDAITGIMARRGA